MICPAGPSKPEFIYTEKLTGATGHASLALLP